MGKIVNRSLSELKIPPLNEKQGTVLLSQANEILFGGAVFGGKLETLDSTFLTPQGFKKFRDAEVGDLINNPTGEICEIIHLHPIRVEDVYRIHFHDGTYVDCGKEHLWNSWRASKSSKKKGERVFGEESAKVITTETLCKQIDTYLERKDDATKHNTLAPLIPVCHEQPFNREPNLPIDPWILGIMISDGHMTSSIGLTSMDEENISRFCEYFPEHTISAREGNQAVQIILKGPSRLRAKKALESFGLLGKHSHTKFIPEIYKYASIEDRYKLIQGLFDGDGYATKEGKVYYCTTSPELREDITFVLRSLGAVVTYTEKKMTQEHHNQAYELYIKHRNPEKLFLLSRRRNRALCKTTTNMYKKAIRYEILPKKEMRCITVSHPNGLYITDGFTVTHNSHLLRVASIVYASMVPGINIYLFRRLTADLTANHLNGAYSYHTLLAPWVDSGYVQIINSAPHEIRFGNGSKIFLRHCQHLHNVYSYQGAEIHVLLMDEGTHFLPEMYEFLRSRVRLGGLKIDFKSVTKIFNDMVANWGVDYTFSEKQMQNYFPKIIIGTNPGNIGHNFFKTKFVDASIPFKIWKAPKDEGSMYRQYIPALYTDNEYGMKLDPNYIDRVRGLGDPELAKAMIEGSWNILSGGAFNGVWDEAIHFIEPFEIPESWYINRSFDWGSAKPFSLGIWAESNGDDVLLADGTIKSYPKGTLFRIDEYYGCQTGEWNKGLEMSSFEIGVAMANKEIATGLAERIKAGPADSSIFDLTKFRNMYTSIHSEMLNGYNSVYKEHTGRQRGELFHPADKSPGSRIKGLEVMRTLFKNSTKEILEDRGLFIFNKCIAFKATVPTIQRDARNMEDVNSEGPDHCYDECRYRVLEITTEIKKLANYL
jgi:hypothetical protein